MGLKIGDQVCVGGNKVHIHDIECLTVDINAE